MLAQQHSPFFVFLGAAVLAFEKVRSGCMGRSYLVVAGMTVGALGLSAAVNCGNSSATSDATTGTGGSTATGTMTTTTTGGISQEPPGPGPMKAGDGATSTTFAISKLYLGNTDPDGTPDPTNGWKHFGYDLDGKISTATSTDLCKPRNNAPIKNVYPDGTNGVDNSFGKNILPVIIGLSSDAPQKINDGITGGKFTIMLDMAKLGTGADYNPLTTQLFAGGDLGGSPKFDGTDKWPVRPELLTDGMTVAGGSKISFPTSYVTGNTWVSGSKGDVTLALSVSSFTLNLTIASAVLTMELSTDHKHATKGIIAGVLSTDTLISELKKVAGAFDPTLCMGPTIDSITAQIAQASDIMHDGSQDPTKQCDGISIGLGFDAEVVQIGDVAPAAVMKPDPCAPDGG
jgi:hypothetical protein